MPVEVISEGRLKVTDPLNEADRAMITHELGDAATAVSDTKVVELHGVNYGTINGGTAYVYGCRVDFVITGQIYVYDGGVIGEAVENGTVIHLHGGTVNTVTHGVTIVNAGTVTDANGGVVIVKGGLVTNANGATVHVQGGMVTNATAGTVNVNVGTVTNANGATVHVKGGSVANFTGGTLDVTAGSVAVNGGTVTSVSGNGYAVVHAGGITDVFGSARVDVLGGQVDTVNITGDAGYANVHAGGTVDTVTLGKVVLSGGTVTNANGGTITGGGTVIYATGDVSIAFQYPSAVWTVNLAAYGRVILENGGTVNSVISGGAVSFRLEGEMNGAVTLKNGGTVAGVLGGTVVAHGGEVYNIFGGTVHSFGSTVQNVRGGTVVARGGEVIDVFGGTIQGGGNVEVYLKVNVRRRSDGKYYAGDLPAPILTSLDGGPIAFDGPGFTKGISATLPNGRPLLMAS
jgi:hypothetical protein